MINIKNITFLNEIGQRPQLEDTIYPAPGKLSVSDRLFLVCDGVGGESFGEEASRIACKEFACYFEQHPFSEGGLDSAYITEAQKYVVQEMQNYATEHPEATRMSTTLTLAYLGTDNIFAAWCGDSRIYHLRNGKVLWRSTDHSLVANLVKRRVITEEEAEKHPQRNIITRSLSASGNSSEMETFQIKDIRDGDQVMLCTDGILEQIDEERLRGIVLSGDTDKKSLFLAYCEKNTRDNFSLFLLDLTVDGQPEAKKRNRLLIPVLLLIIVITLIAGFFRKNIREMLLQPMKQKTTPARAVQIKNDHGSWLFSEKKIIAQGRTHTDILQ